MHDVPWWLAVEPPEAMPLPWSGEVVPIDLPPVPVDVPIAGPVIHFIGEGEHAVWNDVWNWVSGTASSAVSAVTSGAEAIINDAVSIAEAYTGTVLQALSGFINDAFDFAQAGISVLDTALMDITQILVGDINGIEAEITGLVEDVVGIEHGIIPAIEAELANIATAAADFIRIGMDEVKAWAIDNIYDPLTGDITRAIDDLASRTLVGLETGLADAEAYVNAHLAEIAATVAALSTAVAVLEAEATDCVQPMCETLGPNTDLGKLLKGLALAADFAALADLLSLTEPELVAKLEQAIHGFGTLVGTFDQYLGAGGETLGGLFDQLLHDVL